MFSDDEATDATIAPLKDALHQKIVVVAFDIIYTGILDVIDKKAGTIRIRDGENYVDLDIERIQSFRVLAV